MKHLILPLCLLFLLVSCNKKYLDEVEVAPAEVWELNSEFLHDQKYVTNIYADDNKLHVLGLNVFSTITHIDTKETVEHYMHGFEALAQNKFPLNAHVTIGKERDVLFIKPVKNLTTFHTYAILNMKEFDPDFKRFELGLSYTEECIGLSDSNVVLIPYIAESNAMLESRLLLVKLAIAPSHVGDDVVTVSETKVLPVGRSAFIRQIKSMGGKFYVVSNFGLDKVSEEGDIERIVSGQFIDGLFAHKGNYFAVTYDGGNSTASLFTSTTGNSWTFATKLTNKEQILTYHPVSDDLLLASFKSQLFEIDVNNSFNIRELDNTGLEGNLITAIAKTNDKVYVATQSGLFSKSVEQVLTYK